MLEEIVKSFKGNITLQQFKNREELAQSLANAVFGKAYSRLMEVAHADIAMYGGKTPALMLQHLSTNRCSWPGITVVPTDERWVPENNENSNYLMISRNLKINTAKSVRLMSLYHNKLDIGAALIDVVIRLKRVGIPFTVTILGMGTDGHTASFFKGSPELDACLDMNNKRGVATTSHPETGEQRITLTLNRLLNTESLFIHIEGEEKLETLKLAATDDDPQDMPIRAVLNQQIVPVQLYWAP